MKYGCWFQLMSLALLIASQPSLGDIRSSSAAAGPSVEVPVIVTAPALQIHPKPYPENLEGATTGTVDISLSFSGLEIARGAPLAKSQRLRVTWTRSLPSSRDSPQEMIEDHYV